MVYVVDFFDTAGDGKYEMNKSWTDVIDNINITDHAHITVHPICVSKIFPPENEKQYTFLHGPGQLDLFLMFIRLLV